MFNVALFNAALAKKSLTRGDLAKKLGINQSTLTQKIKDEGRFTHDEEEKMISLFGKKETLAFLFSTDVA